MINNRGMPGHELKACHISDVQSGGKVSRELRKSRSMQAYNSISHATNTPIVHVVTYGIPTHCRLPFPNGMKLFSILLSCSGPTDHRSGSKTQGSGNATGS